VSNHYNPINYSDSSRIPGRPPPLINPHRTQHMATPRKPVQQRSIATVEAIIEAGFMAVAEHGLAGTTTRHIAALAGISVGSLYEYFANKEEIYDAMSRKLVDEVLSMIKPLIPKLTGMDIAPAIRTILHSFGELLQRNNGRYLQCVRHGIQSQVKTDLQPINRVLQDLMMQYVMQHPRYMTLDNLPAMGYIFIHTGIFTMIHYMCDPNPPISFDALVDGLATMVAHHADGELRRLQA
jgi:AcrR family transcriptional regulator